MRRRTFIAGLAALGAASPAFFSTSEGTPTWRAFSDELRRRGYDEGRNLAVERRSAEGLAERWPDLVQEIVALKPEVIVAITLAIADELKRTAPSIPVVAHVLDPVEYGLVTSLALAACTPAASSSPRASAAAPSATSASSASALTRTSEACSE